VSSSTPSALRLVWPSPLGFWRFRAESNLGPDLFFRDSCRFARSAPLLAGPEGPAMGRVGRLSWGSSFRPSASTDAAHPLPGEPRPTLRPGAAKLQTRSALAVLPGFGGLLRTTPCRFVAPCIRPWGSPRFRLAPPPRPRPRVWVWFWDAPFPMALIPFGVFPSEAGRDVSPRRDPLTPLLRVSGLGSARVATVGPGSVGPSLGLRVLLCNGVRCRPVGVATARSPDTPLGFVPAWSSMPWLPAEPRPEGQGADPVSLRCGSCSFAPTRGPVRPCVLPVPRPVRNPWPQLLAPEGTRPRSLRLPERNPSPRFFAPEGAQARRSEPRKDPVREALRALSEERCVLTPPPVPPRRAVKAAQGRVPWHRSSSVTRRVGLSRGSRQL
jgi:hypothetical protein